MATDKKLELETEEVVVLFKRMLLLNGLWTGDDHRVFLKLRNWLRRQRMLDRVDENRSDPPSSNLYPYCGCPPDSPGVTNLVCRNPDCIDYGTHRRGLLFDCCQWCGDTFTLLDIDVFKGAR
jgi:hypothetical protein